MMHFLQILRQHLVKILFTILPTSFFSKCCTFFIHFMKVWDISAAAMLIVDDIISDWFLATSDIKYCQRLPSSAKMDYIRFTEGRRLPFGILLKWVGNINIDFIFTKYRLHRKMDLWKTQSFGLNVIFSTCHFQQIQLYNPFKYFTDTAPFPASAASWRRIT